MEHLHGRHPVQNHQEQEIEVSASGNGKYRVKDQGALALTNQHDILFQCQLEYYVCEFCFLPVPISFYIKWGLVPPIL